MVVVVGSIVVAVTAVVITVAVVVVLVVVFEQAKFEPSQNMFFGTWKTSFAKNSTLSYGC